MRRKATIGGLVAIALASVALAACSSASAQSAADAAMAARAEAAGATQVTVTDGPAGGAIVDGLLEGRQFALAIPHDWNGDSVLAAHGYSVPGSPVAVAKNPLAGDPTLGLFTLAYSEGLAVGDSAFDKAGVGVKSGALNTLRLKHFLDRMGGKRVFLAGGSMGGSIVMALIDDHPREFAGALTACGVDSDWESEIGWLINLRAVYDYFTRNTPYALPGSHDIARSGLPIIPPAGADGDAFRTTQIARLALPVAALFKAARADPKGPEAALIRRIADLGQTNAEPASFIVPLMTIDLGMDDMNATFGGVVAGNKGRVYHSDLLTAAENAALNRDIARLKTDPKAVAYADRWHRARGRFVVPLVTLHNAIDPLVPYSQSQSLRALVARTGDAGRLIQFTTPPVTRPLPGVGLDGLTHCGFTSAQVKASWQVLHDWVTTGHRPSITTLPAP